MFVNLKINMCCNNNIINVIKTNWNYGKLNFKINSDYDYIFNCDKVEVIVILYMELICYVFESNCYFC